MLILLTLADALPQLNTLSAMKSRVAKHIHKLLIHCKQVSTLGLPEVSQMSTDIIYLRSVSAEEESKSLKRSCNLDGSMHLS